MDKYEAIRQYKSARDAHANAIAARRAAEKTEEEARKVLDDAHTALSARIVGEAIIFEGKVWTKDYYGRIQSHEIG